MKWENRHCPNHTGFVSLIHELVLNHEISVGPFARLGKYSWLKCEGWIMVECYNIVFAMYINYVALLVSPHR